MNTPNMSRREKTVKKLVQMALEETKKQNDTTVNRLKFFVMRAALLAYDAGYTHARYTFDHIEQNNTK